MAGSLSHCVLQHLAWSHWNLSQVSITFSAYQERQAASTVRTSKAAVVTVGQFLGQRV